ncbi:MAG: 3-phosphoshikimate 1-carboxyvinyltransferase [Actinobacteria bacterium]|nr:3-phosphoshikimate 1-carboxyvinyltransferase [Actinomycetota bacterium]
MTLWRAPFRGHTPLHSIITIPGSKSVTNRALILASLAETPSILRKPLRSRDTELMAQGLRSMGVTIVEEISSNGDEMWKISPAPLFGPASIDVGNAGTVMRFLPPVAALAQGLIHFDGDARSHERPLGPVVDDSKPQQWSVKPSSLHGREITIEPDLSNAAPFLAAPMICGGEVTIRDWPRSTTQPGDQLREIFTAMGGKVTFADKGLTLSGSGKISGIDIDLHDVGELTPSIAAVASLADSPSYLRGIGHLRLHETDRLSALAREINALGGNVVEESDALRIYPAPLKPGLFQTYEDHRLATAGAIIGLAIDGMTVENIETTRKTLPDFPGLWRTMLDG